MRIISFVRNAISLTLRGPNSFKSYGGLAGNPSTLGDKVKRAAPLGTIVTKKIIDIDVAADSEEMLKL